MQIDLSGKAALVTGGAVGIGRGVALALAQAGADVALTYRSHDGAPVAAEIAAMGRRSAAYALDAADSAAVDAVVDRAAAALGGPISILVNNAGGLLGRLPLAEMSDEHWRKVIDVNLFSAFACSRAVLQTMPEGGRIINISSVAGRNGGGRGAVAYAAAKAGMHGLTRGLAKEVGPRGITVNAVAPGLILDTPFHEEFTPPEEQQATIDGTPVRRAGFPADCAGAVLYLASDLGAFCTGSVIDLNGGTYFS
jgi:3-oxoacyl-[acyl-carrier protein] reductase